MSRFSPLGLALHARALLREHGITRGGPGPISVQRLPSAMSRKGWSDTKSRTVHYPTIVSTATYAVALHEIGHVVDDLSMVKRHEPWWILEVEALAWDWARKNAMPSAWNLSAKRTAARFLERALRCVEPVAEALEIPVWLLLPPSWSVYWELVERPKSEWFPGVPEVLDVLSEGGERAMLVKLAMFGAATRVIGKASQAVVREIAINDLHDVELLGAMSFVVTSFKALFYGSDAPGQDPSTDIPPFLDADDPGRSSYDEIHGPSQPWSEA